MKIIINGLRYNTEAPQTVEVGQATGGSEFVTDFTYWEASLYRTGGGRWFIHGEGGPMSRFARPTGSNTMGYGQKIIPVTPEQAREWAERYLDEDIVTQYFTVEGA
jgi:hypothetical protein